LGWVFSLYGFVLDVKHICSIVFTASQETAVKIPHLSIKDHKQIAYTKEDAPVATVKDASAIDMTGKNVSFMPTRPIPPPRHFSNENIMLNPITPTALTKNQNPAFPSSVKSFTVASLQQYTDSFSQENLIGVGMLGSVYRAELPDGKVIIF